MKVIFCVFFFASVLFAQENLTGTIAVDTSYSIYSAFSKIKKDYPFAEIASPKISPGVNVIMDIVYTVQGDRELHLDLFLPPAEKNNHAAVILIHGGGWRSGNKIMEHALAAKLADNGYTAAAVEYRLSPEAKYPAGVLDLKAVVKWLKINAFKYNIDTTKIAALGSSAGGTLAALLGTTGDSPIYAGDTLHEYSSSVSAIIDIDGILDFTHPAESGKDTIPGKPSAGKAWFGYAYKEKPEIWIEASPLTCAGKDTPPILFINSADERFHAGRDELINKIKMHKIYYEVHTIPGTPHTFWLFHPWFDITMEYTISFLNKVFGNLK